LQEIERGLFEMSNPKEPKIYDKTIRSLLKGIPTTFLNLLTGKPISKEKIKLLDVKL
jgi:NADPH-dependent curcumin reductase CurA